eukprot:313264-Chlamydomonas_euryale.AAC.2
MDFNTSGLIRYATTVVTPQQPSISACPQYNRKFLLGCTPHAHCLRSTGQCVATLQKPSLHYRSTSTVSLLMNTPLGKGNRCPVLSAYRAPMPLRPRTMPAPMAWPAEPMARVSAAVNCEGRQTKGRQCERCQQIGNQ